MTFVTRAQKAQQRGDIVRAVFILITGLKRDPSNDDAIDLLLDTVGMHASVTGLEHEIIEVISKREDADQILSILISNLNARGENEAVAHILNRATQVGLHLIADEPQPVTDLRTAETATLDLDREQMREIESDKYIAPASDPTNSDSKVPPNNRTWMLGVTVIAAVVCVLVWAATEQKTDKQTLCADCETFDDLILQWPVTRAKIDMLSDPSEGFRERLVFVRILDGADVETDPNPKSLYGAAVKGIKTNVVCAKRTPSHIALDWCRASLEPSPLTRSEILKEILEYAPNFGPANRAAETFSSTAYDGPAANHLRALFHPLTEDKEPIPDDHPIARFVSAIKKSRPTNGPAVPLDPESISSMLNNCQPIRHCFGIRAAASRAFLYAGNKKQARRFSGDPKHILASANSSWEAVEAFFVWVEVQSQTGDLHEVHAQLARAIDAGVETERSTEVQNRLRCLEDGECKLGSEKANARRWWVHSDPNASTTSEHAAPYDALAIHQPGALLRSKAVFFDDWFWDRWRILALASAGQNNLQFKAAFVRFKAVGRQADRLRGLAMFWQARYEVARGFLVGSDPISTGYLGLLHRATGDRAKGNALLERAGARFARKGGIAFELGRLNANFGKRDVARDYFWTAWLQDWNQTVALQRWCDLLPAHSGKLVGDKLANVHEIPKPVAAHLSASRSVCRAKHLGSRRGDKRADALMRAIPAVSDPWVNREIGLYFLAKEQWKQAKVFFARALISDPTDAFSLWGQAKSAAKLGQNRIANENANRYIELWPNGSHLESAKRLLQP